MIPNFTPFMATVKLGMKQGFRGFKIGPQSQGDFVDNFNRVRETR
jgi:hypothetical protein